MMSACLLISFLFTVSGAVEGNNVPVSSEVGSSCTIISTEKSEQLICVFSKNIWKSRHQFVVLRYDLNPQNIRPDTVLDCKWIVVKNEERFQCTNHSSYMLSNEVSNHAVIEIPQLNQSHEGRYCCQVLPADVNSVECCNYTHNVATIKSSVNGKASFNRSQSNYTAEEPTSEPASNDTWHNVIQNGFGFLVLVPMVIVIVLLMKMRRLKLKNGPMARPKFMRVIRYGVARARSRFRHTRLGSSSKAAAASPAQAIDSAETTLLQHSTGLGAQPASQGLTQGHTDGPTTTTTAAITTVSTSSTPNATTTTTTTTSSVYHQLQPSSTKRRRTYEPDT